MDQMRLHAQRLGALLLKQGRMLTTVESCTGGLVAAAITSLCGSSQWFERGYITYSNAAKMNDVQVNLATLEQFGAVSEQTALEMATGALMVAPQADLAITTTGVAGPTGGSATKPVGMVCFGFAHRTKKGVVSHALTHIFQGDRQTIQQQAVIFALEQGLYVLQPLNLDMG